MHLAHFWKIRLFLALFECSSTSSIWLLPPPFFKKLVWCLCWSTWEEQKFPKISSCIMIQLRTPKFWSLYYIDKPRFLILHTGSQLCMELFAESNHHSQQIECVAQSKAKCMRQTNSQQGYQIIVKYDKNVCTFFDQKKNSKHDIEWLNFWSKNGSWCRGCRRWVDRVGVCPPGFWQNKRPHQAAVVRHIITTCPLRFSDLVPSLNCKKHYQKKLLTFKWSERRRKPFCFT